MSKLSVVPLRKPKSAEAVDLLRDMTARFEAGEFTTAFLIAFRPDGAYVSVERGEKINKLEMIGLLETMKRDVIETTIIEEDK